MSDVTVPTFVGVWNADEAAHIRIEGSGLPSRDLFLDYEEVVEGDDRRFLLLSRDGYVRGASSIRFEIRRRDASLSGHLISHDALKVIDQMLADAEGCADEWRDDCYLARQRVTELETEGRLLTEQVERLKLDSADYKYRAVTAEAEVERLRPGRGGVR